MTAMPHLAALDWDDKNQLVHVQKGSGGSVQHIHFVYDAAGQRVRKLVYSEVNGARTLQSERIYIGGGYETYIEHAGGNPSLERETVHALDGERRVAMVETRIVGAGSQVPVVRYQHDNHLGSACLELDQSGAIISYEEYHPYGTSAYRATSANIDVSAKRYRYTGKERDEETGLSYHGARYLAVWLGRWVSADPAGFVDGINRYNYVSNSPVGGHDPTGMQAAPAPSANIQIPEYTLHVHGPLFDSDAPEPTRIPEHPLWMRAAMAVGESISWALGTGPAHGPENSHTEDLEPSMTDTRFLLRMTMVMGGGVLGRSLGMGSSATAGLGETIVGSSMRGAAFGSLFSVTTVGEHDLFAGRLSAADEYFAAMRLGLLGGAAGGFVFAGLGWGARALFRGISPNQLQLRPPQRLSLGPGAQGADELVKKVVNTNMPHAVERAVERAGFMGEKEARTALQEFGSRIQSEGRLPSEAIIDPAHADRVIIPGFGQGGAVVYQVRAGVLKLKTVLIWKGE